MSSLLFTRSEIGTHLPRQALAEVVLPLTATLCVFLRFWLRYRGGIKLWWDDWLIAAALPFSWGLWGAWYYNVKVVLQGQPIPVMAPKVLQQFLGSCVAQEIVYVNGCNVIKFSILFFYIRSFGTEKRARMVIYALMAFLACYATARFFGTFFQCTPFSRLWNPQEPGTCIDFKALLLTLAIFNLITDVLILTFPLPILAFKLKSLSIWKRMFLCFLFCMGFLACVATAIRIYVSVVVFTQSAASLLDNDAAPRLVALALVELNFGVICASLPAIRAPVIGRWQQWRARLRKDGHPSGKQLMHGEVEQVDGSVSLGSMQESSKVDTVVSTTSVGAGSIKQESPVSKYSRDDIAPLQSERPSSRFLFSEEEEDIPHPIAHPRRGSAMA